MKIIESLYEPTFAGLEKSMELRFRRHEALTSNVANAETPGYRATELTFAGELNRAFDGAREELLRTNAKHIDLVSESGAHLVPDLTGATKGDGNNVDVDIQMAKLSSNMGRYVGTAQLIQTKFRNIKNLLREIA
jgi:flagellar basal-body rod protein FlgB